MHTRFCCALQKIFFSPVLCKFWRLFGGVNGDLLQEVLCHTLVCGTESLCPCDRPLLSSTSTGDAQTLKGRSGSDSGIPGEPKVLFGPLKHLWQVWGLILNAISPLQPSCWSFSLDVEFPFLVGSFILLSMVV